MHNYHDAKFKDIKPKIAVVITSHINKLIYYGNNITDDKLVSIQMNMAAHKHFNAGLEYDLFVVDNGSINPAGVKYLESIRAMKRENEGYSFGGWKWGWEQLRDKGYMFFLFTEDDHAPCKDNWLKEIVDKFFSEPNIGAVGNTVEVHCRGASDFTTKLVDFCKRDEVFTLDGCYTFTSADILRQVDKNGGLIVLPTGEDHEKGVMNECLFQQAIMELGYTITGFNDGEHTLLHGSEIFTNDLFYRNLPLAPIINLNGRFKVPEVRDAFSFYK